MILESALFVLLATSAINQPRISREVKIVAVVSKVTGIIEIETLYSAAPWERPYDVQYLYSVTKEQPRSRVSAAPLWVTFLAG